MAKWNNSGRPASPRAYEWGYNMDTAKIEMYDGTQWKTFSAD